MTHRSAVCAALIALAATAPVSAQMTRERATTTAPVDELFWAPSIISTASVTNLPKGNANVTIMHTFGLVSDGISELWGIDGGANIRFGFDYGLSDRISVGFGRSRVEKVVDLRTKLSVLRQTTDGHMPVELAVKLGVGATTEKNGFEFADRLSFLGSVIVARRMSERVSIQVSPTWSHFNSDALVATAGGLATPEPDHVAIGLAGRYVLNERLGLIVEYVPVIGGRTPGTNDAFAVGLDIETGGHVFQVFAATSRWTSEQYTIARNSDDFFAGDFRLGFNVNRVFGLGR